MPNTLTKLALVKLTLAKLTLATLIAAAPLSQAFAKPEVNKPAPSFTGQTATGETLALSDLRGKTVVLEWTNKDCPYVRKHYGTENMQQLQTDARETFGVTWISIITSPPGAQGYLKPAAAMAHVEEVKASPDYVILDPEGTIGRAYGAVTTPHMYVIDGNGVLRFMGGMDDKPSSNWDTVEGAKNYVRAALEDLTAGRPVAEPVTRPYGCSVKYAS